MKYLIIILIFLPLPILAISNMPTRLENIINTGSTNPNAKPNRAYLNGLYLEFHGRNATDKEMERFKNMRVWDVSNIVAGKQILKRQQASPKATDQDVKELYWKYYVRKPSQAELNNWGIIGGKDATKEALKNFLIKGIPKGIVPWESDYIGKRYYENEIKINENVNLRKRQMVGDFTTRHKAASPIDISIADELPENFIETALPYEKEWIQKNKDKIYGLYNWIKDTIYTKDTDDFLFANSLGHELGHNYDKDYKFNQQKNLFNQDLDSQDITIDRSISRQKEENVADYFNLYTQDEKKFKEQHPKEYEHFEQVLKNFR